MKIQKHIEERITCDICKKDMTCEDSKRYRISDVKENTSYDTIYLEINVLDSFSDGMDACNNCKAKAMFFLIIRDKGLDSLLYPLFKTKKDNHGMDTFIKKVNQSWGEESGVDWMQVEWIKKKAGGHVR